jgi:hypothetical protein
MNTRHTSVRLLSLLSAVMIASSLIVARVPAQSIGQWDFNSGNLTATAGTDLGDLLYADGPGGVTDLADAFGLTTALGIPDISGTPAAVMRFPEATNTMGYLMPTPAGNGGGSFVNEYTLIFDLLYPSNGVVRPLLDADGAVYVAGADLAVSAAGGIGLSPSGPFDGTLAPNTWNRVGFVVNQAQSTIRKYINGVEVGINTLTGIQAGLEGRMALSPSSVSTLILANTVGAGSVGYVNSIQLRDVALNAGQMQALGGPSADGIPQVIPPVPSFVASRTPNAGATGVNEEPVISVVLDQGDSTITEASIQLRLDGVLVGTMTPTPPTYTVDYTVPPRLDPLSPHTLTLTWTDSVTGNNTNSWSFTVQNYQVVTLPSPFFLETFDSFTEDPTPGVSLPTGWTVQNLTCAQTPGFNLDDRSSDSYKDWILVSDSRLPGWGGNRASLPTIVLNGDKLTSLASGNLLWAESDSRSGSCNGQFADLFTGPISCVGRSNVFVAFHSIYMQNQDNMNFMEYSVDGGVNWLPVLYHFDNDPTEADPDIIVTNGVVDVPATFARIEPNRNWHPTSNTVGTNYGSYIKAPISAIKPTDIFGRRDDDQLDGKRIEVVRLPQADGKADVRFRLNANGTSAWFWGVDNFGLYEINTPVILTQPQNRTINATESAAFTVAASSSSPLTYRWQRNGVNLTDGGHFSGVTTATLTVSNAEPGDAGSYRCVVSNSDGSVNSLQATLTVIDAPVITTQPGSALVSAGFPATFSVTANGRPPLSYLWLRNGTPVGTDSSTLNLANTAAGDAGPYRVVVSNITGAVTSSVAVLTVVSDPIPTDLVAHLKFDNNYDDSSGRGNNAAAVGSPAFNASGRIGQAFQYTTVGGIEQHYASLAYPPDLQFGNATDFTISLWSRITPGSKSSDPPLVANKNWDSGGNTGYVLGIQGNNNFEWNYREEAPNTRKDFDSTFNMTDGEWHHVVFSVQRGVFARTYIDGNLVDTRTIK